MEATAKLVTIEPVNQQEHFFDMAYAPFYGEISFTINLLQGVNLP
jgi:hypothetical protein